MAKTAKVCFLPTWHNQCIESDAFHILLNPRQCPSYHLENANNLVKWKRLVSLRMAASCSVLEGTDRLNPHWTELLT